LTIATMQTLTLSVDPTAPDVEAINQAAAVLRGGRLVAFPTETVYGLGANALDETAVARIFLAKGRPATNPVIVHVADATAAQKLVMDWPEMADRLAQRFWPGALSLVLPKRAVVPDVVTAGGPTVALRVPAHPVALALIRAADIPVAAPSANRSTQLSPTRAEHVLRGLDGRIEVLLSAGPAAGGLESTVLDLTVSPPRLLRPGLVGVAELRQAIGEVESSWPVGSAEGPLRSPGQLKRHYAPRTPAEIAAGPEAIGRLATTGKQLGLLTLAGREVEMPGVAMLVLPADPSGYASTLYAALHALDAAGLDRIVIDSPPETEEWQAVWDRLRRAVG
jgi:L-threonylcarbamoyladenylate synthase